MTVILEKPLISDAHVAPQSQTCTAGTLSSLPSILQRIYSRRGIQSLSELDYSLNALLPYNTLIDIEKACERLKTALEQQQHILIIGDFDTDGATSTALGVDALRQFGAKRVSYLVPNRFTFGYGLTPEIVAVASLQQPDLIITVDNGISSLEGVDAAHSAGIDVIITDHHLPGDHLPKACAIINPNQPGDEFASKHIAGVGVIFYLMLALRAHLEQFNWFEQQQLTRPNLAQFLDLVALGTIADVVKLDYNNRILVQQGLLRIRAGRTRPGILALLQVAGKNLTKLQSSDLGFSLGPRLNAAGRLDEMSLGVSCLLANDMTIALNAARQLDQLNQERRALEKQMQQEALAIIEHLDFKQKLPVALCLYDETWHQGIIGLVAGRVKEKLHRPVIAFARAENGILKGSARSIPGLHIRDMLAIIHSRFPYLISKFGGHAMAAGMSISENLYAEFVAKFVETISEFCDSAILQRNFAHDGILESDELTLEMAELLQRSGPWGQGFPEPLFFGHFRIVNQRLVGQRHLKMNLQKEEPLDSVTSKFSIAAIAFEIDKTCWPNHQRSHVECLYRLDINEYQNKKSVQLIIEEFT